MKMKVTLLFLPLTGHVGLTDFRSTRKRGEDNAEAEQLMCGQEVVSFSQDKKGFVQEVSGRHRLGTEPKGDAYKPDGLQMYWCNDTPGIINPEQVRTPQFVHESIRRV